MNVLVGLAAASVLIGIYAGAGIAGYQAAKRREWPRWARGWVRVAAFVFAAVYWPIWVPILAVAWWIGWRPRPRQPVLTVCPENGPSAEEVVLAFWEAERAESERAIARRYGLPPVT